MSTEKTTLTHEESLRLITQMIETSKNRLADDGFHFILWGIILVACCIAQSAMIAAGMHNESNFVWLVLPTLGGILSFFYGKKQGKSEQTRSLISSIYPLMWLGFGISLVLSVFIPVYFFQQSPTAIIMITTGFACFVAGVFLQFNPLKFGAAAFWIGALLYHLMPGPQTQLLLFALAIVCGYLVPGFILRNRYKSQVDVRTA